LTYVRDFLAETGWHTLNTLHKLRNGHGEAFGQTIQIAQTYLSISVFEMAYMLPTDPGLLAQLILAEAMFRTERNNPSPESLLDCWVHTSACSQWASG
jgi:hypothetical protein